MADYNMVPADNLLARMQDELSSYGANGALDVGKLWTQIKWFTNLLNMAVYEQRETIIKVKDFRAELPCDFFLLDSAWLCEGGNSSNQLNFQAKLVVYTETTNETVGNDVNKCLPNPPNSGYLNISACNMDTPVYDKVTTKEYVYSGENAITWQNPVLLSYKPGKSLKKYCSKDCANIFSRFPHEISVNKEGDTYYLYSTLKEAIIYVKYYAFPLDEETNTPLIPDDVILQENLYKHLLYYFFKIIYLNGDDTNIENKLKFLKDDAELAIAFAMNYAKTPSFRKMVQLSNRSRKKFASYEIMSTMHH